jgi:hypothetical protein
MNACKQDPGENDRGIHPEVGDEKGFSLDTGIENGFVSRIRKKPKSLQIKDENREGNHTLNDGECFKSGNLLKPELQVKQVDIQSKEKDGDHGYTKNETLIGVGQTTYFWGRPVAPEKGIETNPAVDGESRPSQE